MTDENTTPAEESTPEQSEPVAEQPAEPKPTAKDKIAEAITEAPKKAAEAKQQLEQRLSPEDRDLLAQLVESTTSKAVNEARDKWEQRAQKAADNSYTQDQVEERIQQALAERDKVADAYRQYDKALAKSGILPDTPEYAKMDAIITEALESGKIGPAALTDESILATWAAANGLGTQALKKQDDDEAPATFVARHSKPLNDAPVKTKHASRSQMLRDKMLNDLNS